MEWRVTVVVGRVNFRPSLNQILHDLELAAQRGVTEQGRSAFRLPDVDARTVCEKFPGLGQVAPAMALASATTGPVCV